MTKKGFVWECECGNIEYGVNPPEECSACEAIESFTKVPDELAEEKEEKSILSKRTLEEDDEDFEEEEEL